MRRNPAHLAPVAPASRRHGAFTLIEILIVVVIIAILMAFVLPAVMGSFKSARITQVQTEMRGMEGAIAQFKTVYGIEPPSRIRLFESAAGWSTPAMGTTLDPITGATLSNETERTRSVAFMNRMWPQFDFASHDMNGDGDTTDTFSLFGPECLVFFLGGRVAPGSGGGAYALTGFSKNPANPFAAAGGTESRDGPYFEFKSSQLHPSTIPAAGGALVYYDPIPGQTAPYIYASSYDGRGYQPADLVAKLPLTYQAYPANVNLLNVYLVGTTTTPQKNKSFQLISPGFDFSYGSGGGYDSTLTNSGLADKRDYDNITNFAPGLLKK